MPFVTLNRNYPLSTTKGYSVTFKKGERTWVPQAILQDAIAIGAIPEEPADLLPPEQETVHLSGEQRKTKIFEVFEKLFLRNDRGDFSASGLPNMKKLEEMTGFRVDIKERDKLWMEFNAQKQAD